MAAAVVWISSVLRIRFSMFQNAGWLGILYRLYSWSWDYMSQAKYIDVCFLVHLFCFWCFSPASAGNFLCWILFCSTRQFGGLLGGGLGPLGSYLCCLIIWWVSKPYSLVLEISWFANNLGFSFPTCTEGVEHYVEVGGNDCKCVFINLMNC